LFKSTIKTYDTCKSAKYAAICLTSDLEAYPSCLYKIASADVPHVDLETSPKSLNNLRYEVEILFHSYHGIRCTRLNITNKLWLRTIFGPRVSIGDTREVGTKSFQSNGCTSYLLQLIYCCSPGNTKCPHNKRHWIIHSRGLMD